MADAENPSYVEAKRDFEDNILGYRPVINGSGNSFYMIEERDGKFFVYQDRITRYCGIASSLVGVRTTRRRAERLALGKAKSQVADSERAGGLFKLFRIMRVQVRDTINKDIEEIAAKNYTDAVTSRDTL